MKFKLEDFNILNDILVMLNIKDNDDIAVPTLFYKGHLLVSIDYFRGSDMFILFTNNLFDKCPQYYCSYKNEIYIYVEDIKNWLMNQ